MFLSNKKADLHLLAASFFYKKITNIFIEFLSFLTLVDPGDQKQRHR